MRALALLAALLALVAAGWFALAPPSNSPNAVTARAADASESADQTRKRHGDEKSGSASNKSGASPSSSAKGATPEVAPSNVTHTSSGASIPRPLHPKLAESATGSAVANSKALETIKRINDFELGRDWAQLVELVKNGGGDAEAKYLASRALELCAQQRGDDGWIARQREAVLKQIGPSDPQRETRMAAINSMQFNNCSAILDATAKNSGLNANTLLNQASAEGDPKAQMFALDQALQKGGLRPETVTEAQWKSIQDALGSQDPAAIRRVGMIMAGLAGQQGMAYGPDGTYANRQVALSAWTLAACDAGLPCGADSAMLVNACAYGAQCNTSNIEQLYQQYQLSPANYSQVQQLRAVISEAIRTNRWDWIGLTPGSRPAPKPTPTPPPTPGKK
jgi:hypothetical protein